MPEIVEDIDPTEQTTDRHEPYAWDQWTDGLTRKFTRGIDFHTTPRDFARQAHRAATKRGYRATTRRDSETVTIRFTPRKATTT